MKSSDDRNLLSKDANEAPLPDYWLPRPASDPEPDVRASFEELWRLALKRGDATEFGGALPAPKWQLLNYLAEEHGVALHGSGSANISLFEPRQAEDLREFGSQKAVYGAADGIWAMFFAVADRQHIRTITSACIRLTDPAGRAYPPRYVFSISRSANVEEAWRSGTVYVLPGDTFTLQPPIPFGEYQVQIPQLASPVPVRPLARVRVEPGDFPYLPQVRTHDDERLEEYTRALETGAPWPD